MVFHPGKRRIHDELCTSFLKKHKTSNLVHFHNNHTKEVCFIVKVELPSVSIPGALSKIDDSHRVFELLAKGAVSRECGSHRRRRRLIDSGLLSLTREIW